MLQRDLFEMYQLRKKNKTLLPSGYQEVEYLQSSGTQYIDTGYKLSSDSVIEVKASTVTAHAMYSICGARTASANKAFWIFAGNNAPFRYDVGTENSKYGKFVRVADVAYVLVEKNGICTVDGVEDVTVSGGTFTCKYNAFLFSLNNAGSPAFSLVGKMYYCRFTNSSILVRDYVPAVRKSDLVAGMYDLVTGVFRTNQGIGSFTKGANV